MKFQSRPVTVEATQYTHPGCNCPGVEYEPYSQGAYTVRGRVVFDNTLRPFVTTIQGQRVYVNPGEWIIREPDGIHYYPCANEVFTNRYFRIDT